MIPGNRTLDGLSRSRSRPRPRSACEAAIETKFAAVAPNAATATHRCQLASSRRNVTASCCRSYSGSEPVSLQLVPSCLVRCQVRPGTVQGLQERLDVGVILLAEFQGGRVPMPPNVPALGSL